jgi:hypothetical protein
VTSAGHVKLIARGPRSALLGVLTDSVAAAIVGTLAAGIGYGAAAHSAWSG